MYVVIIFISGVLKGGELDLVCKFGGKYGLDGREARTRFCIRPLWLELCIGPV